jgi:hypothetical protein
MADQQKSTENSSPRRITAHEAAENLTRTPLTDLYDYVSPRVVRAEKRAIEKVQEYRTARARRTKSTR